VLRLPLAFSGVLCCASIGAFFLFVPPLLIAAVLIATALPVLTVYLLLFRIGIQAELQPVPQSDDIDRTD